MLGRNLQIEKRRATCAENEDHPRAAELFIPDKLPAFHDPFAGGGALSLEAQRLGLEAYASDLNPVAVLIDKAMIEIPPKFAGRPPVNPKARKEKTLFEKTCHGAQGLAEDVRYYGKWMRHEAERRIGHFYPKIEVTDQMAEEQPDLKKFVGQKFYLPPTEPMEAIARQAKPEWKPGNELIGKCSDQLPLYGMNTFAEIFTPRLP